MSEYNKMSKTERNKIISEVIKNKIKEVGLEKELRFEDIDRPKYKNRPTYFHDKDGMNVFSVFMWQLNSLEEEELEKEIEHRIETARLHFGL